MRCVRKLKMDMLHEGPPVLEAEVGGSLWVRASGNSLLAYLGDGGSGFAAEADACSSFVLYCAAQSTVLFGFKICQLWSSWPSSNALFCIMLRLVPPCMVYFHGMFTTKRAFGG